MKRNAKKNSHAGLIHPWAANTKKKVQIMGDFYAYFTGKASAGGIFRGGMRFGRGVLFADVRGAGAGFWV